MSTVETWVPVEPIGDSEPTVGYWETFNVGDRVRVRLNGECQVNGPAIEHVGGPIIEASTHPVHSEGKVGVIVRCPKTPCPFDKSGHGLVVQYRLDGVPWYGHFAACELERLSQ